MNQKDFDALRDILKTGAPEVYQAIMEQDGVMKEIGELPVTQAVKVYTRRRNHLSQKGNETGAKQLSGLLKNLGRMPNTNIRLLSVYFEFGGYTVFIAPPDTVIGIYNVDTNTSQAIEFLERAKAEGSAYPKLFKLTGGNVKETIE